MSPGQTEYCRWCGRGPFERRRGIPTHIRQSASCREKSDEALQRIRFRTSGSASPVSTSRRSSSPSPPPPPQSEPVFRTDDTAPRDSAEPDRPPSPSSSSDRHTNASTDDPINPTGPWSSLPRDPTREPTRGARVGTKWATKRAGEDPRHPFFPWASQREFEMVQWLSTEGLSQGAIDRFLAIQKKNGIEYSFRSAKEMYDQIATHMDGGPAWKVVDVPIPEAGDMTVPLYYRDPIECAKYLFGNPDFREHIDYAPDTLFDDETGARVYHEISSGEIWNELQSDPRIPKGTTIVTIMFASDKTHLSVYSGDQNMHPVYISIGNLHKDVRNKPSRRGWMLLAKLPTHKFAALKARLDVRKTERDAMPGILQKRLFHRCMAVVLEPLREMKVERAVDPEGYERDIVVVLVAWLADLEEQWMILGLAKYSCPKCLARYNDLDAPHSQAPRTGESILAGLKAIRDEYPQADVWQFVNRAVEEGYVGVEKLCWEGLPVDMCRVICVDALHGLHKMFGDHLMKWLGNAVGENELDLRFMAQPRRVGYRNFPSGISHLSQLSGREYRDLERHILPVIAGSDGSDSFPLNSRVVRCLSALLDFISTALIPLHSDVTLLRLGSFLDTFWATLRVFIDIGARTNDSGEIIDHFRIPKLHMLFHFLDNIRDLGAPDNYSTEVSESLHIPFCKEAYDATNRRNYNMQIINYLIRMAALAEYTAYLAWRDKDSRDRELDDLNDDELDADLRADAREEQTANIAEPAIKSITITLAVRPHLLSKTIENVMKGFGIPDLHSSITLFYLDGNSGAHRHRDDYVRADLPEPFNTLNVWTHLRFQRARLNEFYTSERLLLRCKPTTGGARGVFDPVIVKLPPVRTGGAEELRVADLRLIFQSVSLGGDPMAYVHWYTPTSRPQPNHRLRVVKKLMRGGSRAGGIIRLDQIQGPCPLAAKLDGPCPPGLDQNNAYTELSEFYINPFTSHADYERFRSFS